jgi:putative lipoic acid-binding regulatory protein
MDPLQDRLHKLKLVLEETVTFPSEYLFKFIVPIAEVHQMLFILQGMEIEQRASANGNYISVSGKTTVKTSDEVITIYNRASVIKGVISL